jgi:hypothetical protein
MKNKLKPLLRSTTVLVMLTFAQQAMAQAPLPPSDNGGTENRKPGGNTAPLEDGIYIIVAMASALGAWQARRYMQYSDNAQKQ